MIEAISAWLISGAITSLVELALRSTLLLGGALLLVSFARRMSSAERHLILASALIGLLVLPWVPSWSPPLELPLPVWADGREIAPLGSQGGHALRGTSRPAEPGSASSTAGRRTSAETLATRSRPGLGAAIAGAYGLVALALLAHFGLCAWRVDRRVGALRPVRDPDVLRLADALRCELGMTRSVALLTSESGHTPWAWGVARPVIVLPPGFSAWPAGYQRNAIVHELSHIARHDPLVASIARIGRALYWFQPLGWMALRRMIHASESACDDRVLADGASHTGYARQLLEIAKRIHAQGTSSASASLTTAMAGPSPVGQRIRSILAPETRRTTVNGRKVTAAAAASLTLTLLLGVLSTSGSQEAARSQIAMTDPEILALERNGPRDSDELERLVAALLQADRRADAIETFAAYIARPDAGEPVCEFCTALLLTENTPGRTERHAALRSAFEELERRAYAALDGDLLFRIAKISIASSSREAVSRGTWYLFEAVRLGSVEDIDAVRALAVKALAQLGRLEDARLLAGELNEDPASRYYQTEEMRGWITYLDREIQRASALSERLLAVDGRAPVQHQNYLPVYKLVPVYPERALEQRWEGNVVVEFTVNDRGRTQDLSIVESTDPAFEQPALDAAAQFLYMPRVVDGVAVSTPRVRNKITFEMSPNG